MGERCENVAITLEARVADNHFLLKSHFDIGLELELSSRWETTWRFDGG
jgi:hypothetical protein